MKPEFDLSSVDFRITPLENIFLDTYLSQASGDAIKIYLYGWKSCYFDNEKGKTFDKWMEELTSNLFMNRETVKEGLEYWIDTGLIENRNEGEECKLYFKSMLLLWSGFYGRVSKDLKGANISDRLENTAGSYNRNSIENWGSVSEPDRVSDLDIVSEPDRVSDLDIVSELDKVKSENDFKIIKRRKMFEDLEAYLSVGSAYSISLKENEILKLHEFMDKYDVEPEFFIYAYKKASEMSEASSRSLMYLTTIIENWIRFEKITSIEALDEYLEKQEKSRDEIRKNRSRKRKKRIEYVDDDKRMTRADRLKWVEDKLEESRRKSLRGVKNDGQSK